MLGEHVEKPKRMYLERCRGSYDAAKEPFSLRRKLFLCALRSRLSAWCRSALVLQH